MHDGYVLNKGLRKTVMGGHLMDEIINTMVFERNKATKRVRLVPRFRVSRQVLGKNQFKFTELQLACVARESRVRSRVRSPLWPRVASVGACSHSPPSLL